MPRKIQPREICKRGKKYFRVLVPPDLNNGKWSERFFATKADASVFAIDINAQRAGLSRHFFALDSSVQESVLRAVRIMGSESNRIEEAASDFMKKFNNRPRTAADVNTVSTDLLEAKEKAGKRKRYLEQMKHSLKMFGLKFGTRKIHEVSAWEIEEWLNENGWAQSTRRGMLAIISTLFSFAKKNGFCSENMASRVERPSYDERPPGIWNPETARTLLKAALKHDKGVIPYLALCMFAGIRPAEAEKITRADLLKDYINIASHRAKTRQRRLVTRLPAFNAWLKAAGKVELPASNLRRRLAEVRKHVKGLEWPHDVMRHSFASYHLALNSSPDKTAHELGHHNTDMLFRHYRELVTKKQAEEWFGIRP